MSNTRLLELWPTVAATRAAFLRTFEGVSEADALRHPGGDESEWCALQVAQHVLGWTLNVDEIIESLARGVAVPKHPRGYLPPGAPSTLPEVRRALAEASARFLDLPLRVAEQADEVLTVAHEVYGPMTYAGWFERCAAHDGIHLAQAEAALA